MTSALQASCGSPARRARGAGAGRAQRVRDDARMGRADDELGGDKVTIYTATNALQDPHHVEAKPSLIARARSADLVVATGAELEIGWLPLVLQQAGNPKSSPGSPVTSRPRAS